MHGLFVHLWLAGAATAVASPPVRALDVHADGATLTRELAAAGVQGQAVCTATCPPGLSRLHVGDVALAVAPDLLRATGRVRADLALFGAVEADVTCAAAPELLPGGALVGHARGCQVHQLAAGLPGWAQGGATRALTAALDAVLVLQLRQLGAVDLLAVARSGALASVVSHRELSAAKASSCVRAVRGLRLGADRVTLALDLVCDG